MTERQVSRNHRERTDAPLNPSRAAGPYFHVGDYSPRARCIFTRIRRRRCMTYDRAKGLGGTARYFRPSKMPFIHHTALTLTRRGANTFTYRCREEGWRGRWGAEGIVHPVSCMHRSRKVGRWRGGTRGVARGDRGAGERSIRG